MKSYWMSYKKTQIVSVFRGLPKKWQTRGKLIRKSKTIRLRHPIERVWNRLPKVRRRPNPFPASRTTNHFPRVASKPCTIRCCCWCFRLCCCCRSLRISTNFVEQTGDEQFIWLLAQRFAITCGYSKSIASPPTTPLDHISFVGCSKVVRIH